MQDFTQSRKLLILVLYKMYHLQKRLTSLIFITIVTMGEGLIQLHYPLHNFSDNAPINESVFDWLSQFIISRSRFTD